MEKAGLIGLVRMRYIESDNEFSMRGDALVEALKRDQAEGLLPFFVSFYKYYFCYTFLLHLKVFDIFNI